MKKILILSNANSSHTLKWVTGLVSKGYNVKIFTLTPYPGGILTEMGVSVHYSSFGKKKFLYPLAVDQLWQLIQDYEPDIVHAHYASSYGLLGALSRFHPFILSVWGSDVFDFPNISFLHKRIFRFNLKKADVICSTSYIMEKEIKKYTSKNVSVIPFGVDLNAFRPMPVHHVFKPNAIVIGTIKALEKKYGMEYLIDAFALLKKRLAGYSLNLLIVGKGTLDSELKARVNSLGIEGQTIFTGYIPPIDIPSYHNMLTISVFPSIDDSESFGVAAVEAMACEKPVVVSDVGGLPEVIENQVTGLVVPPKNVEKLADAIEILVKNEQLRISLGKEGRKRVERLYKWEDNLDAMIHLYEETLSAKTV